MPTKNALAKLMQDLDEAAQEKIAYRLQQGKTEQDSYRSLGKMARAGANMQHHLEKLPKNKRENLRTRANQENVVTGFKAGKALLDVIEEDKRNRQVAKDKAMIERHKKTRGQA